MARVKGCNGFGWDLKGNAVIDPSVGKQDLGVENAVICYSKDSYPRLVNAFGAKKSKKAPRFDGAVRGKLSKGTALYLSSTGASTSVMMLEEMIASGVKRVLMLGYAGSISPLVTVGDIVIPTWGIREEGASHHYFQAGHEARPSKQLTSRLEHGIEGDEFFEGGVWTTDGVFRETRAKVARYAKMGVLAVEMECTALMCVSEYRHVKFAAILAISDEVFGEKWVPAFRSRRLSRAMDVACESAAKLFSTRRAV